MGPERNFGVIDQSQQVTNGKKTEEDACDA